MGKDGSIDLPSPDGSEAQKLFLFGLCPMPGWCVDVPASSRQAESDRHGVELSALKPRYDFVTIYCYIAII